MTARTTMGTIITYARALIGDTSGTATQYFSDDTIQTSLDMYRQRVRMEEMGCIPTPTITITERKDFYSAKYYEGSATVQTSMFGTLTPDTLCDFFNGQYTFSTNQLLPIYISGNRYDVYAAAADLAERWAAELKDKIDFSADGSSFKVSQKVDRLSEMAKKLRANSENGGNRTVVMTRGDTDL